MFLQSGASKEKVYFLCVIDKLCASIVSHSLPFCLVPQFWCFSTFLWSKYGRGYQWLQSSDSFSSWTDVILIHIGNTPKFATKVNFILLLGDCIFIMKLFNANFKTFFFLTNYACNSKSCPDQLYSPFSLVHCHLHLSCFHFCLLILRLIPTFFSLMSYLLIFCEGFYL